VYGSTLSAQRYLCAGLFMDLRQSLRCASVIKSACLMGVTPGAVPPEAAWAGVEGVAGTGAGPAAGAGAGAATGAGAGMEAGTGAGAGVEALAIACC
jgi:hypothetical protein